MRSLGEDGAFVIAGRSLQAGLLLDLDRFIRGRVVVLQVVIVVVVRAIIIVGGSAPSVAARSFAIVVVIT